MLGTIEKLEVRIIMLEGMIDLLLGKAIADSGAVVLALEDLKVENETLSPENADNPVIVAIHQELVKAISDRTAQGHQRSLRFPRQWKRLPRRP